MCQILIFFQVYDDYKFITKQELEQLGLAHLIGTSLLRAYMHGYFMDIRLYRKAKLVNEPFNFDEFKKSKIREKIEKERENRVKIQRKLPLVNTELAKRLLEDKEDTATKKKTREASENLLQDKRFSELFSNPSFQIDPSSEEFKLLNPVVQKVNEKKLKQTARTVEIENSRQRSQSYDHSDSERKSSGSDGDENDEDDESESESSDDEHQWKQAVKDNFKQMQRDKKLARRDQKRNEQPVGQGAQLKQPKFYEIKDGLEYYSSDRSSKLNKDIVRREQMKKLPMQSRLKLMPHSDQGDDSVVVHGDSYGNKQMTFLSRRAQRDREQEERAREHHNERKSVRRSAGKIIKTLKRPAGPGGSSKFFKKK
jgi:ribosome biogenesis protein ENP2